MDSSNEALKIYAALRPMLLSEIKKQTQNCVRSTKMSVTTTAASGVMGVTEPYGKELFLPYVTSLASAVIGDTVWVQWYAGDMSTAFVARFGDGDTI